MKLIKKLFLVVGLANAFTTQANVVNQDLCYPLAHGEEGMGSRNSMFLPVLITTQEWHSHIHITNTSYKTINVTLDFLNYDASPYAPYSVEHFGQFSSKNSPINSSIAILKPFETGNITIYDNSTSYHESFTGRVSWQADACIDKAIRVDVRTNLGGSNFNQGFVILNGGNPF